MGIRTEADLPRLAVDAAGVLERKHKGGLSSRLLLAPENSESGQLTAGDLYGMRLPADLVTLSACETGIWARCSPATMWSG